MKAWRLSLQLQLLKHLSKFSSSNGCAAPIRSSFVLCCCSSSAAGCNRCSLCFSSSTISSPETVRPIHLQKIGELRSKGLEPYAYRWDRTHSANQLQEIYRNLGNGEDMNSKKDHVSTAGRIVARRAFGKLAFFTLRDDSGTIQLYCEKGSLQSDQFEQLKNLVEIGDILGASGSIKRTEKGELSVYVKSLAILTKSLLPLPDKYHGLTHVHKRYRQRCIDMISNPEVADVFRKRVKLYCEKGRLVSDQFEQRKNLVDIGDILGANGSIKRTEKGELSVDVNSFSIFTKSLAPIPKKYHGLTLVDKHDKRYRQRPMWFIASSFANTSDQAVFLGIKNEVAFQAKFFSSMAGTILVQARDPAILGMEIENALDDCRLDDMWKLYKQHMQLHGFPRKSVVNKLLAIFAESLDVQWLEKAFRLVEQTFEEGKQNLLEKETLIYLSFSLAKSGLHVPASTILRKLVEIEQFPPVAAWSATLAYISQTGPGAYLAAELILEIGYLFQDGRVDPRKKSNAPLIAMKPNNTAFNIALIGCLLFGMTRKAEQLLEMMPRVGIKLDSNLLIVIAHIYARNGRREELKKLQRYINEAPNLSDVQFRQFYNCLLTCHLKLGDLDSAANMVLEMLHKAKAARSSLAAASLVLGTVGNDGKSSCILGSRSVQIHGESEGSKDYRSIRIPMVHYEEYSRDRNFSKLETEAKEVLDTMLAKLHTQVELLTTERGIIQPTEEIFVKLVKAFLQDGKTKDLAEFLIKAEKEDFPVSNDDSAIIHVINSCISLGWLDQAHDLLDEMHLAGIRIASSVYSSLLKAYCLANRAGDIASLLRDVRRAGIQLDPNCYQALIHSKVLQEDTQGALHLFKEVKEAKISKAGHEEFEKLVKGCAEGGEARLMAKLLQEIKEGQRVDSGVHDWNNVIHFFCRKRLMKDAEKALKKMRSLGHTPSAQTFHSMVTGYAAIGGNYIEVTELWGEMKSLASSAPMKFDQELLDSVLYTFVRGGFFNRANEVVEMMERGNMFVDKYKYRTLFLKYHKTLYKGKAPKFQSVAQLRKREAALAFKKWIGLS